MKPAILVLSFLLGTSVAFPASGGPPKGPNALTSGRYSNAVSTELVARQPTSGSDEQPLTWEAAVQKGKEAYDDLESAIASVPQSKWTSTDDLKTNGWALSPKGIPIKIPTLGTTWTHLWQTFNLPHADHSTILLQVAHKLGTPSHPRTGGTYTNIFNPGAIIATSNYSPNHKSLTQIPPVPKDQVTPLKHFSDLLYLQWTSFCEKNNDQEDGMKKLRIIARKSIVTDSTKEIISAALEKTGKKIEDSDWSHRATYEAGSTEFLALLGTKHGRGVARFLAQHKAQLGWKTIVRVSVFNDGPFMPAKSMNVVFELADKPEAEGEHTDTAGTGDKSSHEHGSDERLVRKVRSLL